MGNWSWPTQQTIRVRRVRACLKGDPRFQETDSSLSLALSDVDVKNVGSTNLLILRRVSTPLLLPMNPFYLITK